VYSSQQVSFESNNRISESDCVHRVLGCKDWEGRRGGGSPNLLYLFPSFLMKWHIALLRCSRKKDCVHHTSTTKELCSCPAVYVVTYPDNSWKPEKHSRVSSPTFGNFCVVYSCTLNWILNHLLASCPCYGCYIFKYNYCLFLNTKVFVVWWLTQISKAGGHGFECSLCTIFCAVWSRVKPRYHQVPTLGS
jgi:hypothetical protein